MSGAVARRLTPARVVLAIIGAVAAGQPMITAASEPGHLIARLGAAPPDKPATAARVPAVSDAHVGILEPPVQVNLGPDGRNIVGDAANEPTLAVDPTDPSRLVVVWRQFDDRARSLRTAGWATSDDGGRSWHNHGSIEPGQLSTDPVLAVDEDGRFYLFALREGLESCDLFRSDDGGLSWLPPTAAFGGDKPWLAVDPVRRHVYAFWSDTIGCCGERTFTRSVDGGASFEEPIRLDPIPTLGTITTGIDGEVIAAGVADIDQFLVAVSTDAPNPAATPSFTVTEVDLGGHIWILIPPNPYGLAGQVGVAVDHSQGPRRGTIYVACSVVPGGSDPMDVHLARSSDGGATWSPPIAIASDTRDAWQWFGTIAVAPDGRLDAAWLETVDPAVPSVSELRFASSADGGDSWTSPIAASPPFDSRIRTPPDDKLGDYMQLVSDVAGATIAFPATFNGEQDVWTVRVWAADCDGNGVDDQEDLAAGRLADCDHDRVPDQCQIAVGRAADRDGDGVLDRCEPRRPAGRLGS